MQEATQHGQEKEQDATAERECRICFESQQTGENKLFHPCHCRGTQAYIHEFCLEQWRMSNPASNAFRQCPTCKFTYRSSRVLYARLLTHPACIMALTCIVISTCVILVALLVKWFAWLFLGLQLSRRTFALTSRLVWWAVILIGTVTMIITTVAILVENNRGGGGWNLDIGGGGWHVPDFNGWAWPTSPLFEWCGYGFSLSGFLVFASSVYLEVRSKVLAQMTRAREYVLEVPL